MIQDGWAPSFFRILSFPYFGLLVIADHLGWKLFLVTFRFCMLLMRGVAVS